MIDLFPEVVARLGGLGLTDTLLVSCLLSAALVVAGAISVRLPGPRAVLEVVYEALEANVSGMASVDVTPLLPLVLTQWVFIGLMNTIGLLPGVQSPTRDLSLTAALTAISFVAGHYQAYRLGGLAYLREYTEPNLLFLPFNLLGEVSRSFAMALRLFGNMLSSGLVEAVVVFLAGLLVPVPLMALGMLTALVQAYIFGVLTLVFAAGSMEAALRYRRARSTPGVASSAAGAARSAPQPPGATTLEASAPASLSARRRDTPAGERP